MGSSLLLKGGANTPKSVVETFSISHSFSVGDVVRFDTAAGQWVKSQANTAENSEVVGVVSASSAGQFDVTYAGYITIPTITNNYPVLFLDSAVAGGLTASPPSAIGTVVKPVLTKSTSGSGYVVTNYLGTQIGGSSTVSIDEIQPVGTVVPFAGSVVPDSWLACDGNSYAVGTYPQLYAKLQNSSGDRAPAYGYVAEFGVNTTTYATWWSNVSAGDTILYSPTQTDLIAATVTTYSLIGRVLAKSASSLTVQVYAKYVSDTGVKNSRFEYPNVIPSTVGWFAAFAPTAGKTIYEDLNSTSRRANGAGQPSAAVSTVSVTHFNTPDLRGRFAIGTNTANIPEADANDGNNYSAIAGLYPLGSQGGQEATPAGTGVQLKADSPNAFVTPGTNGLVVNMPPYTAVRYIIKATPYTRAAIIDGLDLPYPNLLVSDLRDGTLRPGGSGEDLLFKTNTGSSGVERMRLSNDGRLGIGMSPALSGQMLSASKDGNENTRISVYNANTGNAAIASLHLNNNVANGYVALYGSNASSHANMTSLENSSSGGGLLLYSASPNGLIQFKVGSGVERMRLSKEGYLGIGSGGVSPLAALDVNGNGNQIWIRPGPGGAIVGATAGLKLEYSTTLQGVIQAYDYTSTGTANRLALNPNGGGVGVGLTAPTDNFSLHVKQASNGAIAFGSQTVYGVLGIDGSSNMVLNAWSGHVFQMGGNEKVRFASDGKVGIGTTAPQNLFVISAGGTSGIECTPGLEANLSTIQAIHRGTSSYDTLDFRGSGFKFRIGITEKIGINSTGDVSIVSTTASGSSKTTGALTVAGGLGVAGAIYAGGLQANTVTASDATASNSTTTGSLIVNGGAGIAGTVNAAGVSAGTGTFTSLTATNFSLTNALSVTSLSSGDITTSGNVTISTATDATSSTSAPLKVSGGVGIAKKLFVGSTDASTSISSGALVVSGGAGIGGAVYAVGVTSSGAIRVTDTTASTASNTGALTVAGGAGISGAVYAAGVTSSGAIRITATTASTASNTGALTVAGGAGVAGALYVGGGITAARLDVSGGIKLTSGGFNTSTFVNITDTAPSTSTVTGALIVAGGAGISGAVYAVGVTSSGAIRVTDTTASTASNTGALTVGGGVGVAGALYVAARATANTITTANGISFGAGSASMPVPAGNAPMFAVRAWACLQWSGTAFTNSASGNIQNFTVDASARLVTLNYATNMPSSNYAAYASGSRLTNGDFVRTQITQSALGSLQVRIEGADGSQILDNTGTRLTDLFVIVVA